MNLSFFNFSRVQEAWDSRMEPASLRVLVAVFWRTLLCLLFIAVLLACWLGFVELSAVSQAENPGTANAAATPPWSPQQLQSTLGFFSQQQSTYQSLSTSPQPSVADPSQ